MVFGMGMPFAQVADGTLTRRPPRLSDRFVAKRHPFKQVAESFVPCCGDRCLFNEHVGSMNRAEQKPTSFAVDITDLNVLTECLHR